MVKKTLSVDSIYEDLKNLSQSGNFSVVYDEDEKDIYTDDYILLSDGKTSYFKGKTIYQESPIGVYKVNRIFDDVTGDTDFEIAHLMEGEDEEGFSTGLPLSDFHTLNKFCYLNNPNYGAEKSELVLSSDGSEVTVDYISGENNRMFSILALMGGNRENVTLGKTDHISITYDEKNNIVLTFSKKDGNNLVYPESHSQAVLSEFGTSKDVDAEEYRKQIGSEISQYSFSYQSTLTLRNKYLSTDTNIVAHYLNQKKDEDIGTYQLDYNPYKIHTKDNSGSESFYRRTESGEAYLEGINALNQVYDQEYYAQSFAQLGFGFDKFDFEGFRYDEDSQSYRYFGLDGGTSLESISRTGLSTMEFDSIQAYVEEGYISKIVATTASSLTQISETEYEDISYTITIDIREYRTIEEPEVYSVRNDTSKIQKVFDKVNDFEHTTLMTKSVEWYDKQDTKSLIPVLTSYYTKDVVYHETTTKTKEGNTYVSRKTGKGAYLIKDSSGNPIGTKQFRVKADGTVEPRSEIQYGRTLKDEWINFKASPLVYESNGDMITPRTGMTGNKLKDYLPLAHTRFESQEGSMANGGDYSGMSFQLRKDGEEVTDEISLFRYYYGTTMAFESLPNGIGDVQFTYGTDENPITVPSQVYDKLSGLGTFKVPTKWSESVSKDIYTQLKAFYQGKKNRYGEDVDVDKDIPYLFDDDLDESWLYSKGQLKNTPDLNIRHDVEDIINDGDINNYNQKYEALLKQNSDYVYTDSSTDPYFPGPFYYVNGDIVISMTSSAYGGIYFYTAIPDYSD